MQPPFPVVLLLLVGGMPKMHAGVVQNQRRLLPYGANALTVHFPKMCEALVVSQFVGPATPYKTRARFWTLQGLKRFPALDFLWKTS